MEVLLESEEQMGQNKQKGKGRRKRQRPAGPPFFISRRGRPDRAFVESTSREREWLERSIPPTR